MQIANNSNQLVARGAGGRGEALKSAALVQSSSYTACREPVLAKALLPQTKLCPKTLVQILCW